MRIARFLLIVATVVSLSALTAQAANRIVIGSDFNLRDCGVVTVGVSIENDVELSRVSLPLILRATGGNLDYPLESLSMSDPAGRLSGSMTGSRTLAWNNYGSDLPNRFVLFFESASLGSDCLPVGPLEEVVQLTFELYPFGDLFSEFTIDTSFQSPGYAVELLDCTTQPVALDEFVAGTLTFFENAPPIGLAQNDPVVGVAGNLLQNQITVDDPSTNPTYAVLHSGPGEISPTGLWSWQTTFSDYGNHTVSIEYGWDYPGCGPGSELFFVEFDVNVLPSDPGDLNCDGQADALDLNALIDHLFFDIQLSQCE